MNVDDILPIWVVIIFLAWADGMWILYQRHTLKFYAQPLIVTLFCEIILYGLFWVMGTPVELRAVFVRTSLILISVSMAFPLTLAYWRFKNGS